MTGPQLKLFNQKGRLGQWEQRLILNNLDKSNRELAQLLSRSEASIRTYLHKEQIRRNQDQLTQIRERINNTGENNGNWKGGRSKNNYYYRNRMRLKYPEKHNARNKLYRAVKCGKLERLPCEVCGDTKSEAHHYKGYDHPLDVQWFCRIHHVQEEKKIN